MNVILYTQCLAEGGGKKKSFKKALFWEARNVF